MGWISVAFSPDGNSIATASGKLDQGSPENQSGEVKIWNSRTRQADQTLRHPRPLTCVAYSPDGTRPLIATTGWDKMLRIWDVRTGKRSHSVRAAHRRCLSRLSSAPTAGVSRHGRRRQRRPGSGTRRPSRRSSPFGATPAKCTAWRSAVTAGGWPPSRWTGR